MIQNTKEPLVALAIAAAAMLGAVSIPVGKTVQGQGKAPGKAFIKRGDHRVSVPIARVEERRSRGG